MTDPTRRPPRNPDGSAHLWPSWGLIKIPYVHGGGVDHLGHWRCDPCENFPDGHPAVAERLAERVRVLGCRDAVQVENEMAAAGFVPARPETAVEMAVYSGSPEAVAHRFGYSSAAEMRMCERSGAETDAEVDAAAVERGMSGGFSLMSEARLAVLDAAEGIARGQLVYARDYRLGDPVVVPTPAELGALSGLEQARRASATSWPGPSVVDGGFGWGAGPVVFPYTGTSGQRVAGAAPVAADTGDGPPMDPEQVERVFESIFKGPVTAANAGRLWVGPVPGAAGKFTEVGRVSEDGMSEDRAEGSPWSARYWAGPLVESVHELVELAQWRTDQTTSPRSPFTGFAVCSCGVSVRATGTGDLDGPQEAREAIEEHIRVEEVAWSENKLTADLRARLKELDADWSRMVSRVAELEGDLVLVRQVSADRADRLVDAGKAMTELRVQMDSLGKLVAEKTWARAEMRAEASRMRTALASAWTRLSGLSGTDVDLVHEQVAAVRERIREAMAGGSDGRHAEPEPGAAADPEPEPEPAVVWCGREATHDQHGDCDGRFGPAPVPPLIRMVFPEAGAAVPEAELHRLRHIPTPCEVRPAGVDGGGDGPAGPSNGVEGSFGFLWAGGDGGKPPYATATAGGTGGAMVFDGDRSGGLGGSGGGPAIVRRLGGQQHFADPADRSRSLEERVAELRGGVGEAVEGESGHGLLRTPEVVSREGDPAAWCLCGEEFTGANLGAAHEGLFRHVAELERGGSV